MSGTVSDNTPWLHVRGQFTWHAEATLVGTRAGLEALQVAVAAALLQGSAIASVVATDGEGYDLEVRKSRTLAGMGSPTYADEEARRLASHEREYLVRESNQRRVQTKEAFDALRWCRANGNPHVGAQPKGAPDGRAS